MQKNWHKPKAAKAVKEESSNQEKFHELDPDVIAFFRKSETEVGIPMEIKYKFLGNEAQKNLIKIRSIPEEFAFFIDADVLVTVNEDYFDHLDEEQRAILMEQEIDKVHANLDTGKVRVGKPSIQSSQGTINKYTYKKVREAIEIEKLYGEQKKDRDQENNEE